MSQPQLSSPSAPAGEQLFRLFAEHAHAVFGIIQGNRFIYANPYLSEISGYSPDELLTMEFAQLVHPESRAMVVDYARRRLLGQSAPSHYEFAMLTKDGRQRWMEISLALTQISGKPAIIGTAFDVTARRQAEHELRRSESAIRDLAEAMPQLVWVADPKGNIEYTNRRLRAYLDNHCVTNADDFAVLLHPDDAQLMRERWRRSQETGEPYEIEYRIRDPRDGSYCWFLGRALAVRDAHGNIVRWYGTCTEIHELKRLQEELAQARELADQARQSAEQANQAKDHFLAVLSHELRTPLTPVLATVSLIEQSQALGGELRDDLQVIRRNVELEARLIDDLLDLTRIVRGKILLDFKSVELCTVLSNVAEICRSDIEARGLHFGIDISAGPHLLHGDPSRLQQIFWNVLKNAIKFTPHGGCVGIRTWQQNGHAITEITDSGVGIEPEALSRIFNAFEQADRRVTRQFGGLGLGLAISKRLVEMHGGTIRARSKGKGRGSTFIISLPIAPATARKPPREPGQIAPQDFPTVRILLVEDHGDTARVLQQLLRAQGHRVQVAADYATAVQLLDSEPFDLLISDLGLPDRSGLELMEHLRRTGSPVRGIALSGYGQEEDVARCKQAGFLEHITKPVDFNLLQDTIRRVTANHHPVG